MKNFIKTFFNQLTSININILKYIIDIDNLDISKLNKVHIRRQILSSLTNIFFFNFLRNFFLKHYNVKFEIF